MLTDIIDTTGKTKLATFYLNSAPRSFHPEEIRKSIKETGSVLSANLRQFVRSGFLKPVERKGEVYYRLNFKYPYLEELRDFLVKKNSPRIRDFVIKELQKLDMNLVILTGLYTGQTNLSVDIILVGKPSPGPVKRTIEKIEKEMRQEINYAVFTDEEFGERVNMHDKFTRDVFENPHLIVVDKRPGKKKNSSRRQSQKGKKKKGQK